MATARATTSDGVAMAVGHTCGAASSPTILSTLPTAGVSDQVRRGRMDDSSHGMGFTRYMYAEMRSSHKSPPRLSLVAYVSAHAVLAWKHAEIHTWNHTEYTLETHWEHTGNTGTAKRCADAEWQRVPGGAN